MFVHKRTHHLDVFGQKVKKCWVFTDRVSICPYFYIKKKHTYYLRMYIFVHIQIYCFPTSTALSKKTLSTNHLKHMREGLHYLR